MALHELVADKRRHRRQPVRFAALLHADGRVTGCIVQDISATGARVLAERPVPRDADVTIDLGYVGQFRGRAVWGAANRHGIAFEDAGAVAERVRAAWGLAV
jgi:hypothetical protein